MIIPNKMIKINPNNWKRVNFKIHTLKKNQKFNKIKMNKKIIIKVKFKFLIKINQINSRNFRMITTKMNLNKIQKNKTKIINFDKLKS